MKTTTKNRIRIKLEAQAALVLLYHSHGDERGLELAATLEKEAHEIWRNEGMEDVSTFDLYNSLTLL